MARLKLKNVLLISLVFFSGCLQKEVNGVKIGHNLYDTQSISFNKKLCLLIDKTLQKDSLSLNNLLNVWCGGASGCYDLGDVIVQIICKLGEQDFIKMAIQLDKNGRQSLSNLIQVGLEYGREYAFGIKNLGTLKKQFPELHKVLQE